MVKLVNKKAAKTNAIRIVEQHKIPFEILTYEISDDQIDGLSVAEKIGHPVTHVYKTLVAKEKANNFVFIIPVHKELDLKAAAKAAQVKKIEMLPMKELLPTTGYIRGGCSPIGMKKQFPTFIDESAKEIEYMIVSAGKRGMQILLSPKDLQKMTNAQFASVSK